MRKPRRVSKSAAIYVPVGALLVIFLTILGISSFLRIMEIEVVGATRYSFEDIISVSGISSGDNLLFLDVESAERRITAAMPFIREAEITRILPDGVKIAVLESTPIAAVQTRTDVLIIDSSGRILERTDVLAQDLIEIRGVTPVDASVGGQLRSLPGEESRIQYMRDLLTAFEREGLADDISNLDVTHTAQITFGYMGRFRVILGDQRHLQRKLDMLPAAVDDINERGGEHVVGTIDISNLNLGARFAPNV